MFDFYSGESFNSSQAIGFFLLAICASSTGLSSLSAQAKIPGSSTENFTFYSSPGFGCDGVDLGGSLTRPADGNSKALVIFAHGSGTTDRDESVGDFKPFRDLAEDFAQAQVATLRFDKRGSTKESLSSIKDPAELSPKAYIEDLKSLIEYSKRREDLQKLPLFLLGHSEGVNFVVEIAKERGDSLAGIILLAGLGHYGIHETLLRQFESLKDLPGAEGKKYAALFQDGSRYFNDLLAGRIADDQTFMNVYPKYWSDWIAITKRASRVAAEVEVPSFLAQGDADWNVTRKDFDSLSAALSKKSNHESFYVHGLNHYLTIGTSTQVDKGLSSRISNWITRLLK